MNTPLKIFGTTIGQSIKARQDLLGNGAFLTEFQTCADVLKNATKIFVAGNGGSASDAQHFVAELVGRFEKERAPRYAEALASDVAVLTAIANDYGYDEVFARQLEAKAMETDVFLAISTSGNSPNILKALEMAEKLGLTTILLTGRDGGKAKDLATFSLVVPANRTSTIQSLHEDILHSFAEYLDV